MINESMITYPMPSPSVQSVSEHRTAHRDSTYDFVDVIVNTLRRNLTILLKHLLDGLGDVGQFWIVPLDLLRPTAYLFRPGCAGTVSLCVGRRHRTGVDGAP